MRNEGSFRGKGDANTTGHVADFFDSHNSVSRRRARTAASNAKDRKMMPYRFNNSVVTVAMAAPILSMGLIGYWWFVNTFLPTTEMFEIVTDKTTYMVGEIAEVTTKVRRYRACRIESRRTMERVSDRREYLVQVVSQEFEADKPIYDRPAGFRFQIPYELTTGDYYLYTRVRYFCNGLDLLAPRYNSTPKTTVHIIGAV